MTQFICNIYPQIQILRVIVHIRIKRAVSHFQKFYYLHWSIHISKCWKLYKDMFQTNLCHVQLGSSRLKNMLFCLNLGVCNLKSWNTPCTVHNLFHYGWIQYKVFPSECCTLLHTLSLVCCQCFLWHGSWCLFGCKNYS